MYRHILICTDVPSFCTRACSKVWSSPRRTENLMFAANHAIDVDELL